VLIPEKALAEGKANRTPAEGERFSRGNDHRQVVILLDFLLSGSNNQVRSLVRFTPIRCPDLPHAEHNNLCWNRPGPIVLMV